MKDTVDELEKITIEGGQQNILASDQIVDSSGLSQIARLSFIRSQNQKRYFVWVGYEKDTPLNFQTLRNIEIDTKQEMSCMDLEFVSREFLIVYCV